MYKQLTSEQRYTISVLLQRKCSKKSIAEAIGVHPSTVTRELKRNSSQRGVYKWDWAQKRADKRSRRQPGNRAISKAVWSEVRHHLVDEQWSPEQISGYLARDGIKISHETIYKWIRQDKHNRGSLYKHLRHRLKHRSRPVGAKRVNIPDRVSIHERPAEADGRRFGDLEMDTIVGPNNQHAIVTVIERNTNRLFMEKLKYGKDAEQLARTVIAMLSPFKDSILSIMTDNGTEFTCHKMITEALGAQVYFADPYSSWQKGAIENANGLIRQYIPKGMPFSELDEEDIGEIADKINARPRKKLGFETPMACFEEKFKKCHSNTNKNSNFAHKTEKKMKKYNYDRLKDAYRQFSTAETEYMKACNQDDEQNQWEKEEILNACTDILTVTVKEILEDEEDFIQ